MTNDDTLLAGFLDRSLSEDQLLELEARKAASPEFAHQFSSLLTVESMLTTATPKSTIPAHFLNTVENAVAAKVLAGGAAGGFLSGLSSAWSWIGGAALALVTAGTVYYVNQPAPQPVVVQQTPSVLVQPSDVPVSQPSTQTAPDVETDSRISTPSAPPTVTENPKGDADGSGMTDMKTTSSKQAAIDQAIADYDVAVQSSDFVSATQRAMTLGKKYFENDDLAKSEAYYAKAVLHARKAKLAELEVQALGEQAKTEIARGNESHARLLLEQAIARGSQITGTDLSVWTRLLKELR